MPHAEYDPRYSQHLLKSVLRSLSRAARASVRAWAGGRTEMGSGAAVKAVIPTNYLHPSLTYG